MEKNIQELDKENMDEEYTVEESEEESENVGQFEETKTEEEGFVSKTAKWREIILKTDLGNKWVKLENMIVTLIFRELDGKCYFNWEAYITSLGYKTRNSPFQKLNPTFKLSFKNFIGGTPFFQNIETEIDNSELDTGLTVKCGYDRQLKQRTYDVEGISINEYNEVVKVAKWIEPGVRIYRCS